MAWRKLRETKLWFPAYLSTWLAVVYCLGIALSVVCWLKRFLKKDCPQCHSAQHNYNNQIFSNRWRFACSCNYIEIFCSHSRYIRFLLLANISSSCHTTATLKHISTCIFKKEHEQRYGHITAQNWVKVHKLTKLATNLTIYDVTSSKPACSIGSRTDVWSLFRITTGPISLSRSCRRSKMIDQAHTPVAKSGVQ